MSSEERCPTCQSPSKEVLFWQCRNIEGDVPDPWHSPAPVDAPAPAGFVYHDKVNCDNHCTDGACKCCCHPKATAPAEGAPLTPYGEALLQRVSDYRSGYSCGYSDAKSGTRMRDKDAAQLFFGPEASGIPDVSEYQLGHPKAPAPAEGAEPAPHIGWSDEGECWCGQVHRLELRQAREKWMGDAETAMRTPMRERDAFDKGYEAGAASLREQLTQAQFEVEALKGSVKDWRETYGQAQRLIGDLETGRGDFDVLQRQNYLINKGREELAKAQRELEEARGLPDKWDTERASYPSTEIGIGANAAVKLCAKELREALARSTGTKES